MSMSTDATSPGPESTRAGDEGESSDLLTGVVGDRCANCQAPLASDQRYCLNCGQRRGKPRFPVGSVTARAQAEPPKPARSGSRFHPNTTLVAGLATLLLAMGVGVLIGKGNSGNSKNAAGVQVLTVGAGGAAASGGGATDATAAAKAHKGKPPKPTIVHLNAKVKAAANNAAGQVLGTSANLVKDPTVQVGQSCSGGAGCQGGKFTGNFFGGGQ
jgi:hypothetical protein